MKIVFTALIALFASLNMFGHGLDSYEDSLQVKGLKLFGTLSLPAHVHQAVPLVIIIAGSGPTDRDGNQPGLHPDTYKKLAEQLALAQIATFRYDKRGAGKSIAPYMQEADLRFTDYVEDANAVIAHFRNDTRFNKIIVAGHSEGSLIGMMALDPGNDFISLCGAGQKATLILKTQLRNQLGDLEASTFKKIDSLENGMKVTLESPLLFSLFRPSVQPYLISWFKIDPYTEIKKVKGRILLVGGQQDLQVGPEQLRMLELSVPNAQTLLFPAMNHALVNIYSNDKAENYAAYNKPEIPLSPDLVKNIIAFIRNEKTAVSE
ncbi:MAG: alpha/beta hydrolase [Chitinophagaceae bacterium]|nr:alpha/beta hydrolase [Chitinophagaceae bacterium]